MKGFIICTIFLVQLIVDIRTGVKTSLIAISGSFDVILRMEKKKKITLNKPNVGLLINANIWRDSIIFLGCCMFGSCFCSFLMADYIRDYSQFQFISETLITSKSIPFFYQIFFIFQSVEARRRLGAKVVYL
jgi:hypothetical protein